MLEFDPGRKCNAAIPTGAEIGISDIEAFAV